MSKNVEKYPGMGAIVGNEGVTFRVWAPHAEKVFVMGTFNDWKDEEYPLEHEADGYWAIFVENAGNGDEYKYVLINGEHKLSRNDPYARKMTHSSGNSIVYHAEKSQEDHHFQLPPFNELVIYEMHIGTFHNKENIENGVGDFYSAVEKLDYLRALGINAIELMPVMEFPGAKSWGYNPSYPFAIESDYGGPDGLSHFIKEAHLRGIAVLMDVVYNHFGPRDTDLWQFDGWQENDKGGIYFYNDYKSVTPWGDNRPDYGREEVRNYLRDNALMWLEAFQCDGLRFDATAYIRFVEGGDLKERTELEEGYRFLQHLNAEIREKYPKKILIAEDLKADSIVTADIAQNGLGFHSQWGLGFNHSIKRALLEIEDDHRNLQEVVEALFFSFNNAAFQRVIYTESHDEVANGSSRLPEEIQPGQADGEYAKKKSTLGAIALFTAPGIPMIFQGQEFLTDSYFNLETPLDWQRHSEQSGITRMYTDLIHLRNGRNGDTIGLTGSLTDTFHFNQDSLVLAFQRVHFEHQNSPVLVILNFSNQLHQGYRIGLPHEGIWKVRFNSGWKGYDEDFSEVDLVEVQSEPFEMEGFPFSILVDLPQYGGVLLSR